MATRAKDIYTADGTTQTFAITFPFISRTHISVTVAGVSATFSFNNDSQITISSPTVVNGNQVIIKRSTSDTIRLVDYVDGSNLTEADLDLDSKQAFYMAQEALDETTTVSLDDLDEFSDLAVATNAGDIFITDGTSFINKPVSGDATIATTGALTIGTGAVNSSKILNDTIVNADINSSAAIAYSKLSLGNSIVSSDITTGTIVDGDINGSAGIAATKIGGGSISNTEFGYLNGVTSGIQTQIDGIVAGAVTNVPDNTFRITDDVDSTKKTAFQSSGITTGTVRTITMADQDIDLTPTTGSYAAAGSGVSAGFAIAMSIAL
tara:strand:+ start:2538 stop:3503 length:966 start_codon:yes stop_codon:yes gene_type:complete